MTKNKLCITLIGLFGVFSAYPCVLTIINDSQNKIFVVNRNDKKAFEIQKGKTKKMGDPHIKADCQVFTKKSRAQSFDLRFELTQNQCAGDGKPILKLSDLAKKNEATRLFTITDHQKQTTKVASAPATPPKAPTHHNHGCSSCKKH